MTRSAEVASPPDPPAPVGPTAPGRRVEDLAPPVKEFELVVTAHCNPALTLERTPQVVLCLDCEVKVGGDQDVLTLRRGQSLYVTGAEGRARSASPGRPP